METSIFLVILVVLSVVPASICILAILFAYAISIDEEIDE